MKRKISLKDNGAPELVPAAIAVNDDTTQRNIMVELLIKCGLHVRSYESADAALHDLDLAQPPAIIVTDLYMPGIDGWRFCRLLRSPEYAGFNTIPVMVVSATFAGDEAHRITAELGANAFLPCPIDGRRFMAKVQSLLSSETPQRTLSVVIVEDSSTQANLLRSGFDSHGYQTFVAHSGFQARAFFQEKISDVVVVDYHLPDERGDELATYIKGQASHVVIVMMTADPDPHLSLEWMKQGVAAYVRKPFEPEYLIALCENARRERTLLHVEELLEQRTRALMATEAQYRTVLENQNDLICRWRPDTTLSFVNEAFCRYFQRTREDLVGVKLIDLIPENARQQAAAMALSFVGFSEPRTTELQVMTGDGPSRWLQSVDTPILSRKGEVDEVLSVARDITERKRADEALRNSEERLQLAL